MAACTAAVATPSTTNATTYASGAFTPALNDLLVVYVAWSAATVGSTPTLSDSQGLGFTRVLSKPADNAGSAVAVFVANALAAASSMTVTVTPGGSCTGANIMVCRVSGMSKTGATAVRQSDSKDKGTDGGGVTTPFATLSVSTLTTNPVFAGGCDVGNNPSAMVAPGGFTQQADIGYTTPLIGGSYSTANSGITATTISSSSSVTGRWQYAVVELDASSSGTNTPVAVSCSAGATCSISRKVGKTVAPSAGATVTLARAVGKTVSAAAAATATLTKRVAKTVSAAAAATAALAAGRGFVKTISMSAGAQSTISRAVGKTITAPAGVTLSLSRSIAKRIAATTNATMALTRGVAKTVSVAAGATVTLTRRTAKTITAAAGATVTVTKNVGKTIQSAAGAFLDLVASVVTGVVRVVAVEVILGDRPATQVDIADMATLSAVQLGTISALAAAVADRDVAVVTLGDQPAPDAMTGDGP